MPQQGQRAYFTPANRPKTGHALTYCAQIAYFCGLISTSIKQLAASISLAVLLNILVKPAWLYAEGLVQNALGHEQFGLFSALFALCYVLTAFGDLGLNQFATREIAQGKSFFQEQFPALFSLKLALLSVFPLVLVVVGWAIGYDSATLVLLFWVAAGVSLLGLLQLFRAVLQAQQRFNTDSLVSVLDKGLLIVLLAVLLQFSLSLSGYVFARLGTMLATVLLAYLLVVRKGGIVLPRWQSKQLKPILKGSMPFAIMTLVYGLNEKIDMVMVERLYSGTEAGLYAAAYRWVDAVMMYLWTILPIFFAKFAAHRHEPREQRELLSFGQVIIAVPIIFVSFVVFFHGHNLFWFLTNSTAAELGIMNRNLQILFLSVVVHGLAAIYSTLLTSTGREKQASIVVGASILLNVVLNFIFIPKYGSVAAAWNTVFSAAFMSAGYVFVVERSKAYQLAYGQFFRLLLLVLVSGVIHYLLSQTGLHWLLASAIAGACMLPFLPLLKLVNLNQLFNRTSGPAE